jgi:hypothetical protein
MGDTPQTETAALLGLLANACNELKGVRGKLEDVGLIGLRLEALERWGERMESKMDKEREASEQSRIQYVEQTHKHSLEIQELKSLTFNYVTLVDRVNNLEKKVFAYVFTAGVAAGVIGALVASGPPWLDRISPQEAGQAAAPWGPAP